jgi:hypothetical protein
VIHTTEQLEKARWRFEQRTPQVLAAFIQRLIHEPNWIANYVDASQGRTT